MTEVCYLIGKDGRGVWAVAGRSAVGVRDSRAGWMAIWSHRDELVEIAHSHPIGPLAFSHEDETTMAAVTAALGRPLRFSVVAPGGMIARVGAQNVQVSDAPAWATALRIDSGMEKRA